jgi:RsiW-degrading membrane proteinase PrsW (M82 family)
VCKRKNKNYWVWIFLCGCCTAFNLPKYDFWGTAISINELSENFSVASLVFEDLSKVLCRKVVHVFLLPTAIMKSSVPLPKVTARVFLSFTVFELFNLRYIYCFYRRMFYFISPLDVLLIVFFFAGTGSYLPSLHLFIFCNKFYLHIHHDEQP